MVGRLSAPRSNERPTSQSALVLRVGLTGQLPAFHSKEVKITEHMGAEAGSSCATSNNALQGGVDITAKIRPDWANPGTVLQCEAYFTKHMFAEGEAGKVPFSTVLQSKTNIT